jgi:CDP-4-dehydro-6-deoxyglucose reductase
MSDPRFTQPWHGVPRDQISWFPTIEPELCNGCGLCATSCGRAVFRYDYASRNAVVIAPVQCMVGCTTCANICPSDAISFQSQSALRLMIRRRHVLQRVKKIELEDRARFAMVPPAGDVGVQTSLDGKGAVG